MSRRPRRMNTGLVLAHPIRAESGARLAYLQEVIAEIEGHAVTIEEVETEIPVGVQQRTGKGRQREMSFCDRPKRHGADRNGLGKNRADDAPQHDIFAVGKTQLNGDFTGQNRAIGTGIDYEMIRSIAIDTHI